MANLDDYINSGDPLSRDAARFLIDYAEEDNRVDYKQTVVIDSEKEWLGLTKDISAFANTHGGYLIFGVSDQNKEVIGLSKKVADILKDVNNLQLKFNKHLEPDISTLRSKAFRFDGKTIVVMYIPQSFNITHLIKKDVVKAAQEATKSLIPEGYGDGDADEKEAYTKTYQKIWVPLIQTIKANARKAGWK